MPIITKNIYMDGGSGTSEKAVHQESTKTMAQAIRDFFVDELNWVELSNIDNATSADTMYLNVTPTYHAAYIGNVSSMCFAIANDRVSGGPYIRIRPFRNDYSTSITNGYSLDNNNNNLCSWTIATESLSTNFYVATIQCSFSFFNSDYCTCFWSGTNRYSIFFYIKDAISFFDSSLNNALIEGATYRTTTWITDDTADVSDTTRNYSVLNNNITILSCYKTLYDKITPIVSPRALLLRSGKIKYLLSDNYFYMSDAKVGKFYNVLDINNDNWLCLCIAPNILVKVKNNSAVEESSNNG